MVLHFSRSPSHAPGEQHAKRGPASGHWCAGDQSAPAHRQREKTHGKPSQGEGQHSWKDSYPREQRRATQLVLARGKWRLGEQLHTKCLDAPRRHRSCLPSTKLCFFVSWTTKKHLCASQSQTPPKKKNTAFAVSQTQGALLSYEIRSKH